MPGALRHLSLPASSGGCPNLGARAGLKKESSRLGSEGLRSVLCRGFTGPVVHDFLDHFGNIVKAQGLQEDADQWRIVQRLGSLCQDLEKYTVEVQQYEIAEAEYQVTSGIAVSFTRKEGLSL